MHKSKISEVFWNHGMEYTSQIREHMSRTLNDNRTSLETTTGDTPDISENLEFDFYSWVKYYDVRGGDSQNDLARWLGVAHNMGQAM